MIHLIIIHVWSHQSAYRYLSGSAGSRSSGVDIRADESLAEDGQEAALGLLALGSAGVDEVVGSGGGDWRWESVRIFIIARW